jgi:hypothetical protein
MKKMLPFLIALFFAVPCWAADIITGDTGFVQPLHNQVGFLDDTDPYRAMMIVDLAAEQALAAGDLIEIDFAMAVLNPNDNRHTTGLGSNATRQDTLFEYDRVASFGSFIITNPYSDPNSAMISPNLATNLPFLIHHGIVQQHAQAIVTDTDKRYAIAVVYGDKNASMTRLSPEYAAGQARMTYKITRGAVSDGRSGNGDDLVDPPVGGEGAALSITGMTLNGTGLNGYTTRTVIPQTALTLPTGTPTKIRVTLRASSSESYTISGAYIGHKSGTVNYAAAPGQFLFGGNAGVTVPANSEVTSDWLTWAYNKTDDLVFGEHCNGGSSSDARARKTGTALTMHLKAAASEAGTTGSVSGYTAYSGDAQLITKIEMDGY